MNTVHKFTQHELAILAGREAMRVLGKTGDHSFNAHWTTRSDSVDDGISLEITFVEAQKVTPP